MIRIKALILNNKGKLLVERADGFIGLPVISQGSWEGCRSLEEVAFSDIRDKFGITDIHPKDFYLYYFSNHIENNEVFLTLAYKGISRVSRVNNPIVSFLELREIKKVLDLFIDETDQKIVRRFIIREDNPNLI